PGIDSDGFDSQELGILRKPVVQLFLKISRQAFGCLVVDNLFFLDTVIGVLFGGRLGWILPEHLVSDQVIEKVAQHLPLDVVAFVRDRPRIEKAGDRLPVHLPKPRIAGLLLEEPKRALLIRDGARFVGSPAFGQVLLEEVRYPLVWDMINAK